MAKQYDLCRFYTTTTGAGTITAGAAVPGFLAPADAGVADGDVVSYGIVSGNNREVGVGTWNAAAGTLTRTTIRKSTNGGAAISLTGTSQVFATLSASDLAGVAPQITKGSGSTSLGATASASSMSLSSVFDDTGAAWSSTVNSDRFTVPAGKSRARVTARLSSSAVPFSGTIYRNGSAIATSSSETKTGASGSSLTLVSDWTVVSPGDYFTIGAYNGYNGTNNISASMQVEWDGIGVSMGAGSSASTTTALYRISTFFTYPPLASEILLLHAVTEAFGLPAGTGGVTLKAGTNPTAATTIDVQKNGTSIGGITIATNGTVSSTIAATSFAAGDVLKLVGPATPDATLANVAISLRGY